MDELTRARWQHRYGMAIERLQRAGIKTKENAVEEYISLRSQWDRYIGPLAPKFALELEEVDTALAKVK